MRGKPSIFSSKNVENVHCCCRVCYGLSSMRRKAVARKKYMVLPKRNQIRSSRKSCMERTHTTNVYKKATDGKKRRKRYSKNGNQNSIIPVGKCDRMCLLRLFVAKTTKSTKLKKNSRVKKKTRLQLS